MTYLRPSAALLVACLGVSTLTSAAEDIDMSKIRALAALPVSENLRDTPVRQLDRAKYWKTIRDSPTPVVVMFYSDVDPESQRLATLVRYVAIKYRDKFSTTPGILFYDNDRGEIVLEDEKYIDADFKEFRTPSLLILESGRAAGPSPRPRHHAAEAMADGSP